MKKSLFLWGTKRKRTQYAIPNHSKKLKTDQRHPGSKRDVGGCGEQQHEQPRDDQRRPSRGGCLHADLWNRHQKGRRFEHGLVECGEDWMNIV